MSQSPRLIRTISPDNSNSFELTIVILCWQFIKYRRKISFFLLLLICVCGLTRLHVPSDKIMRFIDWSETRWSNFRGCSLCVPHPSKKCVHNRRGAARNCVSRNHGITGCRSWLMSLQGVPDRIISLDEAPRGVILPPWASESSATQPDEQSASGCLLNTVVRNQQQPYDRERERERERKIKLRNLGRLSITSSIHQNVIRYLISVSVELIDATN